MSAGRSWSRTGRRRATWVVVGLVVLLAAAIGGWATSGSSTGQTITKGSSIGSLAPPLQGRALVGNGRYALSQLRGHWVLVNFSASWCENCKAEMPKLVAFAREHASDATILTVEQDEPDSGGLEKLLKNYGANWPAIGYSGDQQDWDIVSIPQSFLVDPKGFIEAKALGEIDPAAFSRVIRVAAVTQ